MSVTPNLCCDETKNRGPYTRMTIPRDEVPSLVGASQDFPPGDRDRKFPNLTELSKALTEVEFYIYNWWVLWYANYTLIKQLKGFSGGIPGGSDNKESACNAGDLASIPGSGRSPGGGHGNPLWYSCLENPMDRGSWRAAVCTAAKSCTWLKWLMTHAKLSFKKRKPVYPLVLDLDGVIWSITSILVLLFASHINQDLWSLEIFIIHFRDWPVYVSF